MNLPGEWMEARTGWSPRFCCSLYGRARRLIVENGANSPSLQAAGQGPSKMLYQGPGQGSRPGP